jgi:hypothetical protein
MDIGLRRTAPIISARRCGGWLAVSERDAPLKIGVTAPTEEQAKADFAQAVLDWERILDSAPEH